VIPYKTSSLLLAATTVMLGFAPVHAEELPPTTDQVAKVADGAATFGVKVGDVVIERAELRRLPKAEHLAKAESDPNDHWNPFLKLVVNNASQVKTILALTVKLEDASGASLFEGAKSLTLDGSKKVVDVEIDPSIPLRIGTWKSLAQVHLVASAVPLAIDQPFPLAQTEALVDRRVGSVVVEKVVLTNAPTAEELEQAKADVASKIRPKVSLVLANPTDQKVKVKMRVLLQDEVGATYMDCGWQSEKVAPRARSVSFTQCGGGVRMKAAEWPKVTRARVAVQVD
jgi:hypothetical protein